MDSDTSTQTVFYSWQSDLENRTNRSFIQEALQKAIDAVLETELAIDLVLDRDTQNTIGAPDITQTVLSKIDLATVVVADVSIINAGSKERPSPNPNVLFEFGYAIRALSWDNVLPVFNLATGRLENLPFDLRSRRHVTYTMPNDVVDKKEELKKLARTLQAGIQAILESQRKKKPNIEIVYQSYPHARFGVKNVGVIPIEVIKFSIEYPKSLGSPVLLLSTLVRVEESEFEDGIPTWKQILMKTDASYSDDWRLSPRIDAGETEIFQYPAFVFKEDAPLESTIKLYLSLATGNPIRKDVTLGILMNANKPLAIV